MFKVNENDTLLDDSSSYRKIIGKLLYLTVTRPDISYSVQHLSQFLQAPKKLHWIVALRIVKYIQNQPGLGLFFAKTSEPQINDFCDSNWAACPQT